MWNKSSLFYIFFILTGFLCTVPAFYKGFIVSDDILIYTNWHKCFSEQLFSGDWYPRWLKDMNGGRGSAVFFFYPPLAYYISAFFSFFLPENYPEWFAIYLSFGLALGLSGITMFFLLTNYTEKKWAALISIFYMLAPFHLYVNFYHRFAYSEFWAFTWSPLIIYCIDGILKKRRYYTFYLAFTFTLLLLTHIPTAILLTPFIALYAITRTDMNTLITLSFSVLLSVAISSFYILPMIYYQEYISLETMWSGKYSLVNNFLLSNEGVSNTYYMKIAAFNLLIFIILMTYRKLYSNKNLVFWIFSGLLSIFLMFKISIIIWKIIPFLYKIQFPWRLSQITLISICIGTTIIFTNNYKPCKKTMVTKFSIFSIIIAQVISAFLQISPLKKSELSYEEKSRSSHELRVRLGVPEYIPRWASNNIFSEVHNRSLDEAESRYYTSNGTQLEIIEWKPGFIKIQSNSLQEFDATISQFYFPNWKLSINESEFKNTIPGFNGLIHTRLPSGENTIVFKLINGIPEKLGQAISVSTIFLIFIYFGYTLINRNYFHIK